MDDEIIIGIDNGKVSKKVSNKKNNKRKKKSKNTRINKVEVNKKAVKSTANKKKTSNKKKNNIKKLKTEVEIKKINSMKKIAILFLILFIIILILSSGLFNITNIKITGNTELSQEEIISLSKIEKQTNIFRINKLQSIQNIKENAYIENVTIKRKLPNEIDINVKERVASYMLQFADSYVYINNQGYMLKISNERLSIPILVGVTTDLSNIQAGNRINVEDLEKMNTVIEIVETAKRNEISDLITKIDISNDKNYTLILESEGKTVYLGDCTELNTRMLYLKDILEKEKGNSGEVFLNVDLNTRRVYFREST